MILENFFSVPIIYDQVDDTIISNSISLTKKYIASTAFDSKSAGGKTITTFYDDRDYLGTIQDQQLMSVINTTARHLLSIVGLRDDIPLSVESWLNLNIPGTSHQVHRHFGAILGGVVYLETTEGCGDLVFLDPVTERTQANVYTESVRKELNNFNFPVVKYKPVTGRIIMFEGWLPHTVDVNKSTENRISISFNIWKNDGKN
jgi:uncharacterized protein (TIGR02466 family)